MTATNVTDFKKFITLIPQDILKSVWFFPLRQDRKNPDVPGGTVLKGNLAYRLDVKSCVYRLKQGKNFGIYGLPGGLMFLDIDVSGGHIIATKWFIEQIPPTFTVRTRNGGYQYYYMNRGLYPNQIIKENGVQVGELRTNWYYVVGVGSYVTPDKDNKDGDGTYRIIHNAPIGDFSGMEGYIFKGNTIDDTKRFTGATHKDSMVSLEDYNKNLVEKGKTKRRVLNKDGIEALKWQLENKIPRGVK